MLMANILISIQVEMYYIYWIRVANVCLRKAASEPHGFWQSRSACICVGANLIEFIFWSCDREEHVGGNTCWKYPTNQAASVERENLS